MGRTWWGRSVRSLSKTAFNISVTSHATAAVLDKPQHFKKSTLSQSEVTDNVLDAGEKQEDVA